MAKALQHNSFHFHSCTIMYYAMLLEYCLVLRTGAPASINVFSYHHGHITRVVVFQISCQISVVARVNQLCYLFILYTGRSLSYLLPRPSFITRAVSIIFRALGQAR